MSQNETSHIPSLLSNTTTAGDSKVITEIYPTKENGRVWYMNMSRPENDSLVSITFDPNITKNMDGSWHMSYPHLRFNVNTPRSALRDKWNER